MTAEKLKEQRPLNRDDPAMTFPEEARRGLMLVLSSPSGAGKTTLSRRLMAADDRVVVSVSSTTRPPRPAERDSEDYVFVDDATFDLMVADDAFLEHATVFGHRYGTPRGPVEEALAAGRDVLFDIDWQGTQKLHLKMPQDLVRIFILPPSMAELERRLRARAQDPDDIVRERMAKAAGEISHWAEYDYVLVNRDLDACLAQVRTILEAERLRLKRRPVMDNFVDDLLAAHQRRKA